MFRVFKDRNEAAKKLAVALKKYKNSKDVVILGLLRGGIVPAFEVAKELNLLLDFVVLRKIGAPGNPELAIGAVTEDDLTVFDSEIISGYNIKQEYIDKTVVEEKEEIERRVRLYRQDYPKKDLKNKTAIIIDDGIATGSTVRVAAKTARLRGAGKVIIAVPVCPSDALVTLKSDADEVICIHPSDMLFAIGAFYDDFPQLDDKEVLEILKKAKRPKPTIAKPEEKLYKCEVCGLTYRDKEWAEKCEKWCKENKSCNIEITKHAVENEE